MSLVPLENYQSEAVNGNLKLTPFTLKTAK